MQLPPLEPLMPHALKDFSALPGAAAAAAAAAGSPIPLPKPPSASPMGDKDSSGEQEVIRINDDSSEGERSQGENGNGEIGSKAGSENGQKKEKTPAGEDLQRLQSMIMELNNSKRTGH